MWKRALLCSPGLLETRNPPSCLCLPVAEITGTTQSSENCFFLKEYPHFISKRIPTLYPARIYILSSALNIQSLLILFILRVCAGCLLGSHFTEEETEVVKNTYSKPQAELGLKLDYEVARLPHASIRSAWRDLEKEALRSKGSI